MRSYHKTGNKIGRPAYRTPAAFRYRKYLKNINNKITEKVLIKKFRKKK